ncbi:hypothetical protein [Paenibacillus macerans]|uniref:hypothetical protein n=1 Tax=Paenibacillus macerans TaxID=44252 RepID=UPI003D314CCF
MRKLTAIQKMDNEYMERESLSLSQFAKQIGFNAGSLSYILNGNRTMNSEQLDHITEGIGLPVRPLFTYIAYSDLLSGNVCEARGDYEKNLQYIERYADLDWVKEDDEEASIW